MINPQDYPEHTPEWVLAKFFEAWDKRNWKTMLKYCQLSWVKRPLIYPTVPFLDKLKVYKHSTVVTEKILFNQFKHKLLDAKILGIKDISDVTKDISIEIYYKDINVKRKMRRKVRLICEKAPMQPSPEGQWGINPTSMIRARK